MQDQFVTITCLLPFAIWANMVTILTLVELFITMIAFDCKNGFANQIYLKQSMPHCLKFLMQMEKLCFLHFFNRTPGKVEVYTPTKVV